jgi:tRNA splicing ligase
MKLADYLNTTVLKQHIADKLVFAKKHPTLPLTLYCYTRKAVYDNIWTDVTRKCRGLIVDDEGVVVSRPFEKFFEYDSPGHSETYERNVEALERKHGYPRIQEKINGNLGIFWKYGMHWGIASKGSFTSPHAKWAETWMADHIENFGRLVFPIGYTPVFEMICQDVQGHAIKYDTNELVLIALINNQTGEEMDLLSLQLYGTTNELAVPDTYEKSLKTVLAEDREGHEGYVLTYNIPGRAPLKLKIKHPSFIKARRAFYDALQAKEQDETDAGECIKFDRAKEIVLDAFKTCTTRKEFAEHFNRAENKEYAAKCFTLLEGSK